MTNVKQFPAPLVEVPADEALKAEAAEVDLFEFEYEGHTYKYDLDEMENDSDILEAFEEGKMIVPIKLLLSDEQYKLWKSRGKNGKRSIPEVGKFAEAMFAGQGVTPGESSG